MSKFDTYRWGSIVGVIDSYDAVHSQHVPLEEGPAFHDDLFPMQTHKRWRWTFCDCFSVSVLGDKLTDEDYDLVMAHMTKKYGIKFWENGHHDIDNFISKMSKENR